MSRTKTYNTQYAIRNTHDARRAGSALILAVVLVSLLAVVGVMFLLTSRVDSIATSAISENRQLNYAVDTVVAQICAQLAIDVPGALRGDEYYDYPDGNNAWLASLEPCSPALNIYRWQQISDIYGVVGTAYQNVPAMPLPDYNDLPGFGVGTVADADGDGVSDSMWAAVPGLSSSKAKPIYAAIRIIDNGGMLNVNTGFKFDPCTAVGSSQAEVNLMALSDLDYTHVGLGEKQTRLMNYRCGLADADFYEENVVWQYDRPDGAYTPFDISDELKLRNRYILNHNLFTSRIETLWTNVFDGGPEMPRTSITDPCNWFRIAYDCYPNPELNPYVYDNRHIATTHNIDRIIDPNSNKMLNLNLIHTYDPVVLCDLIERLMVQSGYAPAVAMGSAAQTTANLLDYFDSDVNDVNVVYDTMGNPYYGFERPAIFLSELVSEYDWNDISRPYPPEVNLFRSYAVELYKIGGTERFDDWQLVIPGKGPLPRILPVNNALFDVTGGQYAVFLFEDPCVPLRKLVKFTDSPRDGAVNVDPNVVFAWPPSQLPGAARYDLYLATDCQQAGTCSELCQNVANADRTSPAAYLGSQPGVNYDPLGPSPLALNTRYCWRIDVVDGSANVLAKGPAKSFTTWQAEPVLPTEVLDHNTVVFYEGQTIELQRHIPETGQFITVDSVVVPDIAGFEDLPQAPFVKDRTVVSFQRDNRDHKCLRGIWGESGLATLGHRNEFQEAGGPDIQPFAAIPPFTNVGQIGAILRKPAYIGGISPADSDATAKIDLLDPAFQSFLNYLTVVDPLLHGHSGTEMRVKGRVNINTAPWFVLAQLPWVSYHTPNWDLARAIVNYRDNIGGPFKSAAELMRVTNASVLESIDYYSRDNADLPGYPDLTGGDDAPDDFEERDVIFARVSNLVTVRSDVFTAYILLRIGRDGPQKRVIAILDRSEVTPTGGRVKVIAVHPVADPR